MRGAGVLLASSVLSVIASSAASGYRTTVIAQDPSITPGLIRGVILLIVGILVQRSAWNLFMPLWYHLVFLGLLIPGSVLGWWLRT